MSIQLACFTTSALLIQEQYGIYISLRNAKLANIKQLSKGMLDQEEYSSLETTEIMFSS